MKVTSEKPQKLSQSLQLTLKLRLMLYAVSPQMAGSVVVLVVTGHGKKE